MTVEVGSIINLLEMAELDGDHEQVVSLARDAVVAGERMMGSRAHAIALLRSSAALIDGSPPEETLERCFAATREESDVETLWLATVVAGCATLRMGNIERAEGLACVAKSLAWTSSERWARAVEEQLDNHLASRATLTPESARKGARAFLLEHPSDPRLSVGVHADGRSLLGSLGAQADPAQR